MNKRTSDIRTHRLRLGLAQNELATKAKVSLTNLRKWERGLEIPDINSANRIAEVLDVPVNSLLVAQESHADCVVPGEGYTTAKNNAARIVEPRLPAPLGKKKVLDIFCGCGGLSFGFEQSGHFVTTCGIDLLSDRIETFVANHPYAKGIAGDLRSYSLDELHKVVGEVDVVVGGPPCQGFSSIRPFRNLTEGDPRNSLAEHYVLIINNFKPQWFMFENVVGILTHENGERLQAILDGMRAAGYRVDWRVVNAAHFGIPQNRERVVIVGNRLGIPFEWAEPTHFAECRSMAGNRQEVIRTEPIFSIGLPRAVTLMEAIGDLPKLSSGEESSEYAMNPQNEYQRAMREGSNNLTLHRSTRHSEKMLEIIKYSGPNINSIPKGMVTSGFSSCYSRLDANKPSTTITVNFVHPASNRCIHPDQNRALTPREGARIQSFPDHFVFHGTSAQIVKQIGNAVPPLLGKVIAESIHNSEIKQQQAVL